MEIFIPFYGLYAMFKEARSFEFYYNDYTLVLGAIAQSCYIVLPIILPLKLSGVI